MPRERSRLVGQEFAHRQRRDDLYAPTPPSAAAQYWQSTCASRGNKLLETTAYSCWTSEGFSSTVRFSGTCISSCLPKIRCPREENMVGKLDKAMYGTKDAPAAWQAELEKTMIELGFRPVVSNPCLSYHPSWGIRVVGHVEDLMCVCPRSGVDIFLAKLQCVHDLSSTFLEPDAGE